MGAVLLQAWGEERCLLLWHFVSEKNNASVLTLVQKHEDKLVLCSFSCGSCRERCGCPGWEAAAWDLSPESLPTQLLYDEAFRDVPYEGCRLKPLL